MSERVIQDILDAPLPTDRTALRSVLDLANYVQTCSNNNVPHASDLLKPMWDFLSRERLVPDAEIEQCVQRIKQEIRLLHPRKFFQTSMPAVVVHRTRRDMVWVPF